MAALRLRAGGPADAPAILGVHRASILGLAAPHYSAEQAASWARGLSPGLYQAAMRRGERFLLAEAEGALAGFCSFRDDEIVGLYVLPEMARGGVGRQLLLRAEAALRAAGVGRVRVCASLPGRAFYEAEGYRPVRDLPWTTRGGLPIRVTEMEKLLAPDD